MDTLLTANGVAIPLNDFPSFFSLGIEPSELNIDPEASSPSLSEALRSNAKSYAALDFKTSATDLTNQQSATARFNLIFGTSRGDYLIGSPRADVIFGFGGSDTIYGGGGGDRLFGGQGIDILNGEAGNDLLYGGTGNDVLDGGAGDDRLFGESGNDLLWGSIGNDVLDGGAGRDIANYSELTQAITLEAIGKITKSALGNDQLKSIEVIIGAQNQRNKIDASMVNVAGTSLDADLSADSVNVKGIPGIGEQSFIVQNFREVSGTQGNDRLRGSNGDDGLQGNGGNDTFIGSGGRDTLQGGAGYDSATYNEGISLRFGYDFIRPSTGTTVPTQIVKKLEAVKNNGVLEFQPFGPVGGGDADRLELVEKVVGAIGKTNSINFAFARFQARFDPTPTAIAPPIDLDLGAKQLKYEGQQIQVENFVNVLGSFGNDRITGDGKNNEINGFAGNDTLKGGGGNDTLVANEGDTLTGGEGADQFKFIAASVLDGGRSGVSFRAIEANRITDFEVGRDRLVFDNSSDTPGSIYALGGETTRTYTPFRDLATGALPANQFVTLGSSPAPDSAKFLYDSRSGDLFYQGFENLPGPTRALKITTLQGAPRLSASDFLIV